MQFEEISNYDEVFAFMRKGNYISGISENFMRLKTDKFKPKFKYNLYLQEIDKSISFLSLDNHVLVSDLVLSQNKHYSNKTLIRAVVLKNNWESTENFHLKGNSLTIK